MQPLPSASMGARPVNESLQSKIKDLINRASGKKPLADVFAKDIWPKLENDYQKMVETLMAHCESLLREKKLSAKVSGRAKSLESIELSIERREKARQEDKKSAYGHLEEIFLDVHDLAGIKVIMKYPEDIKSANQFIENAFEKKKEPNVFKKDRDQGEFWESWFGAYESWNHHVTLQAGNGSELGKYDNVMFEIQLTSYPEDLYNQLAHPVFYKGTAGDVCREDEIMMDISHALALCFSLVHCYFRPRIDGTSLPQGPPLGADQSTIHSQKTRIPVASCIKALKDVKPKNFRSADELGQQVAHSLEEILAEMNKKTALIPDFDRVREDIWSIQSATFRMTGEVQGLRTVILDDRQRRILERLPIAAGASFNSYAQQYDARCLANTRVKLLGQILEWANDSRAESIFWLKGKLGTGKSTISRTVAQSLADKGLLGASFFFKRGEADRESLAKFFTTLAADLAVRVPATAPHIAKALDDDTFIITKTAQEQFEELLEKPLSGDTQNASEDSNTIIVIDALDECEQDNDIRLAIRLFSQARNEQFRRVRIFLTSRPEPPIRLGFTEIECTHRTFALEEISENDIKSDISLFLKHEFTKIQREYNLSLSDTADQHLAKDWPTQSVHQALVNMAVPLFIVAATICRFVSDDRCGIPDELLQEVLDFKTKNQGLHLEQMDETYMTVLNKLIVGLSTKQVDNVLQQFRDIIGPILLLASPLSTSALAQILGIKKEIIGLKLAHLHSVLSIPSSSESPVRLLHRSFRDFLLDSEKCGKSFWINDKQTHEKLAAKCLRKLGCLKQDICGIKAPGTPRSTINRQIISDSLSPEVQYACLYWVYHLQQAGTRIADSGPVHNFLTCSFLYWLEALSLLGRALESLHLIQTLRSLLAPQQSKGLSDFLEDAMRFVRAGISVIDSTPLQLYSSLLIYTPNRSKIRTVFEGEIANWINLKPKIADDWNNCLQTLDKHSAHVQSVVFSHDSVLIASASSDKTVRIWRADSGKCLQILKGHTRRVNSVAFSHDSLVASGSDDSTVRVWHADSGKCLKILKGHTEEVYSVAFSHDSLIASGSEDGTVRIWHADSGKCTRILEGHGISIWSVAFSHDSRVASGSEDSTVWIWHARSGKCLQILEGHTKGVNSVAFSYNSTLLASGSSDETVRIWRADTGKSLQTVKGHSSCVRFVTISNDSALIASGNYAGTVRIWRVDSGECIQRLKHHGGQIPSVEFSHDSKLIARSVDDGVRIWRAASGKCIQTLGDPGPSTAFSHDSALIALSRGYPDLGEIRIWHANSGKCLKILERQRTKPGTCVRVLGDHRQLVEPLVFSNDSTLVASGSWDATVRIWRADTGKCIRILEGHSGYVDSVTFSHDSSLIASGSNDTTVRIWHVDSDKCLHILEGHSQGVKSVAFSSDSTLVASGSWDATVRIWRADTGVFLQTVDMGPLLSHIWFKPDRSYLQTNVGAITLPSMAITRTSTHFPSEVIPGCRFACGISRDGRWVTWNEDNLLWLPVEARPKCVTTSGSTIVIGCNSGEVHVIGFSPHHLPILLRGVGL